MTPPNISKQSGMRCRKFGTEVLCDDPSSNAQSAAAQIGLGIGDTIWGIIQTPNHLLKRITGIDSYLGQDRAWSLGNLFRAYSWSLQGNPLFIVGDTANHIFYGGLNTLTAGLTHTIFNQWLGLNIQYFTPPPKTIRESARVVSGGILVALPLKGVILKGMGIKAPPVLESVSETAQVSKTDSAIASVAEALNARINFSKTARVDPIQPKTPLDIYDGHQNISSAKGIWNPHPRLKIGPGEVSPPSSPIETPLGKFEIPEGNMVMGQNSRINSGSGGPSGASGTLGVSNSGSGGPTFVMAPTHAQTSIVSRASASSQIAAEGAMQSGANSSSTSTSFLKSQSIPGKSQLPMTLPSAFEGNMVERKSSDEFVVVPGAEIRGPMIDPTNHERKMELPTIFPFTEEYWLSQKDDPNFSSEINEELIGFLQDVQKSILKEYKERGIKTIHPRKKTMGVVDHLKRTLLLHDEIRHILEINNDNDLYHLPDNQLFVESLLREVFKLILAPSNRLLRKIAAAYAINIVEYPRYSTWFSNFYEEAALLRAGLSQAIVTKAYLDLYTQLAKRFHPNHPEVYLGAEAARNLFNHPDQEIQFSALDIYQGLIPKFHHDQVQVGLEALKRYPKDSLENVYQFGYWSNVYWTFLRHFPERQKEIYFLLPIERNRWARGDHSFRPSYVETIKSNFFRIADPEIYEEAQALREIVKRSDVDSETRRFAIEAYFHIAEYFSPQNGNLLKNEFWGMLELLQGKYLDEFETERITYTLVHNFQKFNTLNLWEELTHSPWMEKLPLPADDKKLLIERLMFHKGRILSSRDRWRTLLRYLTDLDDSRKAILHGLLEAQGKPRDIFSTLSAVLLIPKEIRNELSQKIAQEISTWPQVASSQITGRAIRAKEMIYNELIPRLAQRVRINGPRKWETNAKLVDSLYKSGTLDLFLRSAYFMDQQGRKILGTLLDELSESEIVQGKIIYKKRYEELIDIGFHPEFVKVWAREYEKEIKIDRPKDPEDAKKQVIRQAIFQIEGHRQGTLQGNGRLSDFPKDVEQLLAKFKSGEVEGEKEVRPLLAKFEEHYQEIRKRFGDNFANIRTDLRNLITGLQMGVTILGKKEGLQISGRVEEMAKSGNSPSEGCQRLNTLWSEETNGRGQPLNRILHGQFKVANYFVDDQVVARRILETTRNEKGESVLLVHRLYSDGRFISAPEFRNEITTYAKELGISEQNVHFDEDKEENVPRPLNTGDEVLRDNWEETIDPNELPPQN